MRRMSAWTWTGREQPTEADEVVEVVDVVRVPVVLATEHGARLLRRSSCTPRESNPAPGRRCWPTPAGSSCSTPRPSSAERCWIPSGRSWLTASFMVVEIERFIGWSRRLPVPHALGVHVVGPREAGVRPAVAPSLAVIGARRVVDLVALEPVDDVVGVGEPTSASALTAIALRPPERQVTRIWSAFAAHSATCSTKRGLGSHFRDPVAGSTSLEAVASGMFTATRRDRRTRTPGESGRRGA